MKNPTSGCSCAFVGRLCSSRRPRLIHRQPHPTASLSHLFRCPNGLRQACQACHGVPITALVGTCSHMAGHMGSREASVTPRSVSRTFLEEVPEHVSEMQQEELAVRTLDGACSGHGFPAKRGMTGRGTFVQRSMAPCMGRADPCDVLRRSQRRSSESLWRYLCHVA